MAANIDTENFTVVLNNWVSYNDLASAKQLKSMVYYHLKAIVKKNINDRKSSINNKQTIENTTELLHQLPNTTSLLHEALIQLHAPDEIYDNREQYFLSLATFVRWVLLDELKAKNAQKRSGKNESITQLLNMADVQDDYILFDESLTRLESLSARCYKVALLHYYLGYGIDEIKAEFNIKKSTVYNELSTAKAYLRNQYKSDSVSAI